MKSAPANGYRWICSLEMTDCRKRCGCRNSAGTIKKPREPRRGEGRSDGNNGVFEKNNTRGSLGMAGATSLVCGMDRAAESGRCGNRRDKEFATVRERRGERMMNRTLGMSLILCGALGLSAGLAGAQQAPPPPPPHAEMMQGEAGVGWMAGPIGERIELLGFEGMHGGKVVTGAPFSAVAVSETTQTLADGNRISRKTQTNLFRDSQGRFRKEVTLPAIGPLATSGEPKSFVFINDPVANANFILHPDTKTAEQMGKRFGEMKVAMKDAIKGKMERIFHRAFHFAKPLPHLLGGLGVGMQDEIRIRHGIIDEHKRFRLSGGCQRTNRRKRHFFAEAALAVAKKIRLRLP